MVVSGCHIGPVLTQNGWLVDATIMRPDLMIGELLTAV